MAFKDTDFVFYNYNPSLVAAIIFILLFSSLTVFHAFQLIRKGTWYFIPFLIGCICSSSFYSYPLFPSPSPWSTQLTIAVESIGYIGRIVSSKQSPNWTLGPYICQSLLILLAPALFAASIYMILGRIILLTDGETHSVIRARWLTKVFVAGDVLSFLAQSAGMWFDFLTFSHADDKNRRRYPRNSQIPNYIQPWSKRHHGRVGHSGFLFQLLYPHRCHLPLSHRPSSHCTRSFS
jgi:hypothetical protein